MVPILEMSFDFELLMLKPTPQQDLEHGVSIHFLEPPPTTASAVSVDRKEIMQQILPSLHLELPQKFAPRTTKPPPIHPAVTQRGTSPLPPVTFSPHQKEKATAAAAAAAASIAAPYHAHKDTVRGRLVITSAGSPWICPEVARLEEANAGDKIVVVYTPVSDATWWKHMLDKSEAEMHYWENVSGSWQGSRDKPSNFRLLADVDQDAVLDHMLNAVQRKYRRLNYASDAVPGDAAIVILDDVEDFCDAIVQKNVEAVHLYNHLMASPDIRIVALSQYPCYRDPAAALPILFNLLHGISSSSKSFRTTTRQEQDTKKSRKTKRRQKQQQTWLFDTTLTKLPEDFYKRVSPMIVMLDPTTTTQLAAAAAAAVEKCPMTEQQLQLYRHETDAVRRRMCCTFAIETPTTEPPRDDARGKIIQETLSLSRIVDDQDLSVPSLEKFSPKFLRVLHHCRERGKGGSIVVYTNYEVHGQLFRSMLEKNGFGLDDPKQRFVVLRTERDVENLATDDPCQIYLMIASSSSVDNDDMWCTGAQRLDHVDAIHFLDIPEESWVQTLRIRRKVGNPASAVIYVSSFSQSLMIQQKLGSKLGEKSQLTQAQGKDDGSDLYDYCKQYLGDAPATITVDEQMLEDLLVQNHAASQWIRSNKGKICV